MVLIPIEGKSMYFDPNVKSLKLIPKNQLQEFIISFLSDIELKLNKQIVIQDLGKSHTASINVNSKLEADAILSKISISSFRYLDEFIKEKFMDDPKNYLRNMILFESEINDKQLILKF